MSSPFRRRRVAFVLGCAFLYGPYAGAQEPPPKPPEPTPGQKAAAYILVKVESGAKAYDQKDYQQAVADLSEALRLDPNNARALLLRGKASFQLEDWDRSIADFSQLIKSNPKEAAAYHWRGYAYHQKAAAQDDAKPDDLALADLAKALELDPDGPDSAFSYVFCGTICRSRQDYDRALAAFDHAVQLDPTWALAYRGRGLVYFEKKDYESALRDYSKSLELDPAQASTFGLRGTCYVRSGQYDRAIADYTEAIKLDPNQGAYYRRRGFAYEWKGDNTQALRDLDRAVELAPADEDALAVRAGLQLSLKAYDEAIADSTRAIRIDAKDADAWRTRGTAYRMVKAYERALLNYETALKLDPKNAQAYSSCAWLYATCPEEKHRDGKKAEEYAAKARELSAKDEDFDYEVLAAACAEQGRFDDAVQWQKKALERLKDDDPVREEARQRLRLYEEKKPFRE